MNAKDRKRLRRQSKKLDYILAQQEKAEDDSINWREMLFTFFGVAAIGILTFAAATSIVAFACAIKYGL